MKDKTKKERGKGGQSEEKRDDGGKEEGESAPAHNLKKAPESAEISAHKRPGTGNPVKPK